MKYYLLIIVCFMSCFSAFSQTQVSHSSSWFYIEPTESVHIKGSLTSLSGNTDPLINLGQIYVSDSVNCYGDNRVFGVTPDTITANVFLNGSTQQIFGGNTPMKFGNLFVKNTYDSLKAINDVEIYNFIQLDSGNIYIENVTLDLLNKGRLIGEDSTKRIYTSEYGKLHFQRPLFNGQTYTNIVGTGLGLTINGNLGTSVEVYRKNTPLISVANGSIDRFYYFNPQNNGFVSAPKIEYLDSVEFSENQESDLRMYKSNSFGTTWDTIPTNLNVITNEAIDISGTSFPLTTQTMITLASSNCDSPPAINFIQDTLFLCSGVATVLNPIGITGMSSVWSTGEVNVDSIQVTATGTYVVSVTNPAGCYSKDSVVIITVPTPSAGFTTNATCIGDVTSFTNTSTVASGTISSFWNLNDVFSPAIDTTSILNPTHLYTFQGTYPVTLTVVSDRGCINEITTNIDIKGAPIVSFNLVDDCVGSSIITQNFTVTSPVAPVTYSWDFGNGDTNSDSIPVYTYPTDGSYNITLSAQANGCTSSLMKQIEIFPTPLVSYTANGVCANEVLSFINTSTINSGIMSYYWQLDATTSSNLANPTHIYPNSGNNNVTLTATSNKGCMDDTTLTIIIDVLPTPEFTVIPMCVGDSVSFINNSNVMSTFSWDFGNTQTSTDYSPKTVFTTTGNQTVSLTETSTNGCSVTIVESIISKTIPVANFSYSTPCLNEQVFFSNSSTASLTSTTNWSFSNGNTSTDNSPNQLVTNLGSFVTQLIVNDNGCLDTLQQTIQVNAKPVIDLGGIISTCGTTYNLDALNTGSTYLWSDASTNQNLTINSDGQYWVSITNANACVESDTVQIILNTSTQPSLGVDDLFCDAVNLDAGYPSSTYLWSNGAATQNTTITTSGSYWVTIVDQNGCSGSDTIVANIVTSIVPTLGNDLEQCEFDAITLNPIQTGISYVWNTGETTATINPTTTDDYWVDLTDVNGCVSRDSVSITFNPSPILDLGLDGAYCSDIAFDVTQPNVTYLWENGSTNPIRTITADGTYWTSITNTTTGCNHSDTLTMFIVPPISIDLGNDTIICSGQSLVLDALNTGAVFLWSSGETTQIVEANATGTYAVFVHTPDGCETRDTVQVIINELLDATLGNDAIFCSGSTLQLSSPIDNANYQWQLNDEVLSETTQSIIATEFGVYISVVTDNVGCTVTDTIVLTEAVTQLIADYIAPTDSVYVGDTIQFINLSAPNPYYSYWSFDDGIYSNIEDPAHTYFFEGDYEVTLSVSDSVCTKEITKTITILASLPDTTIVNNSGTNEILNVLLYPNPNNGVFNVDVELEYTAQINFTIIDILGHTYGVKQENGTNITVSYDVSSLQNGSYFLRIQQGMQVKYVQFIKQ